MKKKSYRFLSSLVTALLLSVSVTSCYNQTSITNANTTTNLTSNLKYGTINIKIAPFVKSSNFKIKAGFTNFTDASITDVKMQVEGLNMTKFEKTFNWKESESDVNSLSLSVPAGKNRIVTLIGLDTDGNEVAKLMGAIDVIADYSNQLTINYGTTPVARVLYSILNSNRKDLLDTIDGNKLKVLVNKITGFLVTDNTYTLVNPNYVDVNAIVQSLLSNNGDVAENKTGLDNEIIGKLKITIKDEVGNPITSGITLRIDDITNHKMISNSTKTNMDADPGVWKLTAKAFINSGGSITIPVNDNEEKNLILSGGERLYAEKVITVKDSITQDIELTLKPLKVKDIKLFEKDNQDTEITKIDLYIDEHKDFDAKVIFDDDSSVKDEVVWQSEDEDVFVVNASGVITALKTGSGTLKLKPITNIDNQDTDKTYSFSVNVKDSDFLPMINEFTPTSGTKDTIVTIKGKNFDDMIPENNIVRFNGIKADVLSATTESIRVKVPEGSTFGYISVETLKGKVLSTNRFAGATTFTNMISIPSTASFTMGSDVGGPSETPTVNVSLNPYKIDTYEVTNKDYRDFVDANGYTIKDYWTNAGWEWKEKNSITEPLFWNDSKYNQDNQPVVGVSWYEAYAYANWKGKRLATEAEWERVAKGTENRVYPWGNDFHNYANGYFGIDGGDDGFKFLSPVGSFESGKSQEGVYDLAGNVLEWVADWYKFDYYSEDLGTPRDNPTGPISGQFKVVRGGAWTYGADKLTSSYRDLYFTPESRNFDIGFRCVK